MNIIDKFIINRLNKIFTAEQKGSPMPIYNTTELFYPSQKNTYSTDKEILEGLDNNPIFSACVYKIAEQMSSIEWKLFVNRNSNGKAVARKSLDTESMTEVSPAHPFYDLVDGLNPDMPGAMGWILTYSWWIAVGKAYWIIERNTSGMPIAFYPVPSTALTNKSKSSYQFNVNGIVTTKPAEDVIEWHNPSPVNPYGSARGVGKTLGDEIYVAEQAAKLQGAYFKENGMPPAVISPDTGVTVDKDVFKRFEERFVSKMKGLGKQYIPYFTNAPIRVQQLANTFRDLQLSELQKDHRDMIINAFGMSKEMLGVIDNSNRATVEAAAYMFLKFVIEPKMNIIRSFLQARVVPLFDDKLVIDYVDFIPEDKDYKAQIMREHEWAFTRDEIRNLVGYGEGGGEDYSMVPFNLLPDKEKHVAFTKARKNITPEKIDLILQDVDPELLKEATTAAYRSLLIEVMRDTYGEINYTGSEDILSRAVTDYLNNKVGTKIQGITETTRNNIRRVITEGMDNFLSTEQIADNIAGVFDVNIGRLDTIARTETHTAQSFGVNRAYKDSGLVKYKRWIHNPQLSEEPRDEHAALDGLVVGLQEEFQYMGMTAPYPGGFGIAEQDINCHCTEAAVIDEDAIEQRDYMPLWTKRRNTAIAFEPKMRQAYADGFKKQKEKTLEAFRRLT